MLRIKIINKMYSNYEDQNSLSQSNNNIYSTYQINNKEIISQDYYPTNIYFNKYNDSNHEFPSKQNYNQRYSINEDENSGDISSKIFSNNNPNLESTFSQTYRTFKYEPLNSSLNQTLKSNNSLNSFSNLINKGNCPNFYKYKNTINNDDYNNIFNIKKEASIRGKSPIVNNYIEQIRKVYENEHNNMRLQQCQLQNQLLKTNEFNERKINFLNSTINEMKSKNENDINNLTNRNEFELKIILDKKEKDINMLSDRNYELEIANNDLIEKINEISNKLEQDKKDSLNKISYYQSEIYNQTRNNNDLKNYYEEKLNFLTRFFAEEKNKLKVAYESRLDGINLGYSKSKKEYENKAQNNKLKNLINDYSVETDKLKIEIKYLNDEILRLKNQEEELIKNNDEMKRDNDILNEDYENAKKDLQYQIKQTEFVEKKFNSTQNEFFKLKAENEKLNRLTYGIFKRSKSKGVELNKNKKIKKNK